MEQVSNLLVAPFSKVELMTSRILKFPEVPPYLLICAQLSRANDISLLECVPATP